MTAEEQAIVSELYNRACHHPRCERSDKPHECSCGVSAALERVRILLGLRDHTIG